MLSLKELLQRQIRSRKTLKIEMILATIVTSTIVVAKKAMKKQLLLIELEPMVKQVLRKPKGLQFKLTSLRNRLNRRKRLRYRKEIPKRALQEPKMLHQC